MNMAYVNVALFNNVPNPSACSYDTTPNGEGIQTYPHTFESPIDVELKLKYQFQVQQVGTQNFNDYEYLIEGTAKLTGYQANNKYPCVRLTLNGQTGNPLGIQISGESGIFTNVSITEKQYRDGSLINTYTATTMAFTRRINATDTYGVNRTITVEKCTIPLIFENDIDYIVSGVPNASDIYCYNNPSGLMVQLPNIAAGYSLDRIINAKSDYVPELNEFFFYGYAHEYTVDDYGNKTLLDSPSIYRGFRIKTTGKVSLYTIKGIDDGKLKYHINKGDGVQYAEYSNDGEHWEVIPARPTELPFDFVYREWKKEIGTFYCSGVDGALFDTNCYIFNNKEDSDDYNDTGEGGEKAENYNDIYPDKPFNPTGIEDIETEFGQVYTRSFFSQQYILSVGALSEIANAFFDTNAGGMWDAIKTGLSMYGDSPVDDIQGLYYLPFNANEVFTNTQSQNYIYFGGYKFDFTNASVNRIIYPNGYYDFGSFVIETTFGENWRSYEPYTKLFCYLAYIGWVQLDMKKYLHKTVNVRYYFDTRTGGCVACLIANGVLCDFFNGQIGVSMPITATDFVAYANAQIQTLLGFGKGVSGQISNVGNTAGEMMKAGATATETLAGAGALGGLGIGLQGAKTIYGLTQNNINNFNQTIGGSSSMLNMFLPQEVCFMFEVQDAMPTANLNALRGYPSNASGSIGSFTGYLEVDTVNLICSDATANEKAEIIAMLQNGIYI